MLDNFRKLAKRIVISVLVFMLALTLPPAVDTAGAQNDKKATEQKQKRKKGRKGKKDEEKPPTMADAIGNVTPVGRGHRKLVIPQFDPVTGKRSSTIKVSSVEREDEVSLRLQGLDLTEYGPDGSETLRIEVRTGNFDLTTGILTGDSYSRVSVPGQFEIVGEGLVCDTATKDVDGKQVRTQFGKMMGPLRMTIFGGSKMKITSDGKTVATTGKASEKKNLNKK